MAKKENKGLLALADKMGGGDKDSIVGKMNESLGKEFLEGILTKIKPFISPMISGIGDALGDDEYMCILKKNKKDGRPYVHIIETNKVKKFVVEDVKEVIDAEDFINVVLSGDIADMMKEEG